MLWAVVGLSTVAASMISTGRNDVALASNLREAAVAEAAADGAINRAGLHLLPCREGAACDPWPADGRRIDAGSAGVTVGVCILDEAGRVNPNTVGPTLMAELLKALDVEPDEAARLATAIAQWRTPAAPGTLRADAAAYRAAGMPYAPDGRRFATVEDLRFVLGMSPAILARLRPNLSVWAAGEPNPALATPAVRTALASVGLGVDILALAVSGANARTATVVADAATPGGGRFVRTAVVQMGADPSKPPMAILAWSAGQQAECR